MVTLYEQFPTWESLVSDIIEESGYSDFWNLPGDADNIYWELDNEFYGDGHGKLIDNWVFTWHDYNGSLNHKYKKTRGFPTLEEALEAKLFNGESIHDLYNRKLDWSI